MVDTWRFYAQRPVSGEWMDNDVQFSDISITKALSAPNSGTAALVTPENEPIAEDGKAVWGKWNTLLYAERNGSLDSVYIADSVAPGVGGAQVKLIGASGWFGRVEYSGVYQVWETNCFNVMRELIDHATSKPRGINWVRPGTNSLHTVGDPQPPPKPNKPPRHKGESKSAYTNSTRYQNYQDDLQDWQNTYGQNEKFKIVFWESPYVLDEIQSLASDAGFDWREQYRWVSGQLDPEFKINFADDLSVFRDDIAIVDGMNVAGRLFPTDDDEGYANKVLAIGSGQGRKTRKATATVSDRLYAARFLSAKHVHNQKKLQRRADAAIKRFKTVDPQIGTVNIYDVDGYASVASLKPGDIVAIRSDIIRPRLNTTAKIQSITETPLNPGRVQIEFITQAAA